VPDKATLPTNGQIRLGVGDVSDAAWVEIDIVAVVVLIAADPPDADFDHRMA